MIKAIETVYGGCRFRSRLEARWAVFFDVLGVKWVYEPQGYEAWNVHYLPDFYLPDLRLYVEVKPSDEMLRDQIPKLRTVLDFNSPLSRFDGEKGGLLLLGDVPDVQFGNSVFHPVIIWQNKLCLRYGIFVPANDESEAAFCIGHRFHPLLTLEEFPFGRDDLDSFDEAWTVEPFLYQARTCLSNTRKAYEVARQARFEHGSRGAA